MTLVSASTPDFDDGRLLPVGATLRAGALTPRCAVVILSGPDVRYTLPGSLHFRLVGDPRGERSGTVATSAIVLDDLTPATSYVLSIDGHSFAFSTPNCAGAVNITEFGASPTATNNADAIEAAIAAAPEGGTVFVPEGEFLTSPLALKPNMTLHLSKGAVLKGSPERSLYGQLPSHDAQGRMLGSWEGLPDTIFKSLITAIDCPGLTIAGTGTLDGGGSDGDWWSWPKEKRDGARRPRTIYALRCDGLTLAGVTVCNSPSWTVHPVLCNHAVFAGLTIWNPSDSPNTDGLDPEMCRHLSLDGIHFSVGDDCIAIKAGKRSDTGNGDHLALTSHITVRNCRMERGHGAVVMGSEMSGSITDVTISDCEFVGTDRGLRVKTRRGRGGEVARILCERCTMEDVDTPLSANAYYFCDWDGRSDAVQDRAPAPVTHLTPKVHSIVLKDTKVTNARLALAAVLGLSEAPITGVVLDNVSVTFDPDAVAEPPLMANNIPALRHADVWSQFAEVRRIGSDATPEASRPAHKEGLSMLLEYFDANAANHRAYKGGAWCYEDGLIYQGLVALADATDEKRFLRHAVRMASIQVSPDGNIRDYRMTDYNIDNIQPGRAVLKLFEMTGDTRFKKAADTLIEQLKDHPRTKGGNYWHKKRYPWQVWLDGLNMGITFQIQYGLATKDEALVDDALNQLVEAAKLTYVEETGLYAHAYDEARAQDWADAKTGHNKAHWARALGWMAMALIDACEMVGLEKAAEVGLLEPTTALFDRLVDLQTQGNLWLQVIDQPEVPGNYEETSASAMFALAMMVADRIGVAKSPDVGAAGRAAFVELVERMIDPTRAAQGQGFGQMVWVAGLGEFQGRFRDGSAEYYTQEDIVEDDPKGVGPMMRATAEYISQGYTLPEVGRRYVHLPTKAYG